MQKVTLYSRSSRAHNLRDPRPADAPQPGVALANPASGRRGRVRATLRRFERPLLLGAGALLVLALVATHARFAPVAREITQKDIEAAVQHSLETMPPASPAAKAYDAVSPSVVRVFGTGDDREDGKPADKGIGTGVVVVDTGIILTNLHVVADATRIQVTFADGFESEATIVSVQPENDLAVIKSSKIPDDLMSATLRSTADLNVGDQVVAVGFPFGIGPSASSGVVSGLAREYRSPEGKRVLTNLIQFDAAANPGNSGGPLVTMDGEVVGIVTAILNPTEQRVFIGIGFAVPIENAASAVGLSPF